MANVIRSFFHSIPSLVLENRRRIFLLLKGPVPFGRGHIFFESFEKMHQNLHGRKVLLLCKQH